MENEITIKVTEEQADLIAEALKYRFVHINNDAWSECYYKTYIEVKHQIENQ